MAEREGGETIRQMLAGFNAMQMQLGLLPQQTGQQPMGVQLSAAPPPPPVMHPGAVAAQATMAGQQMMMHTVQAAQMTRYTPPPSMPIGGGGGFGWGGTMNAIAGQQFNPYVAGAIGGGGGGGGGMPSAMFATSPQYGMYRPSPMMGGPVMSSYARIPSVFNPLAPTMPSPHFSTPAMQQLQMLNAHQTQAAATLGGFAEGGLGLGGSVLGGALGSAFGPLGSIAGSWLGGKIGGAVSNMTIGPAMDDIRRGRMLQNTTAPFLVTGANLNPYTGQGLERGAARDTATGLRQLSRDYDFQRTGFNTGDVMKMTQLASDQGLLATAHNPDEIVRKMKDISKAVKSLVQITGDPDIRNAISSLGQMRNLGFEGLSGQMGAVANRAMFARMAGVSQATMNDQYGMPGAMMAQGVGLAGSTGYTMGMASGGAANVAVSGGAFSDLQLARGGGKQGVAQTNLMAQLGAANQDIYMAAALRRNAQGGLDVDVDAYRRAQTMPISQVSSEAANRLRSIGPQGIFELSTRKQEFKDRLQQSLSPTEQMLSVVRQAQGLQKEVGGGMTLGAALKTMIGSSPMGSGMGDAEREQMARTLELQFTNRGFYDGMQQQLRVQRREAGDRARAFREQYRTPGLASGIGQSIREGLGGLSDSMTSPFRALAERSDRVEEDRSAFERGEQVRRFSSGELIKTAADTRLAAEAMGSSEYGRLMRQTGPSALANGGLVDNGRSMNRLGQALGLNSYSGTNRLVSLGNQTTGNLFGFSTTYGSVAEANRRVQNVAGAARLIASGSGRSAQQVGAAVAALSQGTHIDAMGVILHAAKTLQSDLPVARAGGAWTAGAAGEDLFRKHAIAALRNAGMPQEQAEQTYEKNKELMGGEMARVIYSTGDHKSIETMEAALKISGQAGSIDMRQSREELAKKFESNLHDLGLAGAGGAKTLESVSNLVKNTDPRTLALAAALQGKNYSEIDYIRKQFGTTAAGTEAFTNASVQAARLVQNQSKDVQAALGTMGRRAEGHIESRIRDTRRTIGMQMSRQAFETTAQRIGEQVGMTDLGGAGSVEDLMMRLGGRSDDDISRVKDKGLQDAIRAYRKASASGDTKGMAAASARFKTSMLGTGAEGSVELFGGEQSGTASLDKQIAQLEDMKKQLGTGTDAQTQQVFASSVELFAQAASDLKAATENMRFNDANPNNAGRY